MKNILSSFNSENLKRNIKNVFSRFTISTIIILIIAILFFTELHFTQELSDLFNKRVFIVIISLIITFIFSVSVYLSSENTQKNKLKRNILQLIPILFGILFYTAFNLDSNSFENFLLFFLSFAGILSYLFFAPYLKNIFKKPIKQSVFYTYFYNLSVVILISFIFGGVLFALGAIGIGAVDALFDLNISEKNTYGNWAILSLSVVAPLFTLAKIPEKKDFISDNFIENTFFSFLTKYIAIPFIYLYFFILYAYSVKVLINFSDWPKGEVSWMVIGFSVFGYLTYIFSYIFEEKNQFIRTFRKLFPYVVIPQIFMLFYAIYLRIGQYDLTVNRYFIVVFGLWLAVVSLYYIFSKKKYLHIIPTILTLFTIIISLGPWGVYSLPESRQLSRLENNLVKANILNNKKISPLQDYNQISQDLSKDIYSGIDYLCDFNNCNDIKELFPEIYSKIYEDDKKEFSKNKKEDILNYQKNKENYSYLSSAQDRTYEGPNKWKIISGITGYIKVKNYFSDYSKETGYLEYSKKYSVEQFPLDIIGYSKIYKINSNKYNKNKGYAIYDAEQEIIILGDNSRIPTKKISEALLKKYNNKGAKDLEKKDLIFEITEQNKTYKLIFNNISIKDPSYKQDNNKNYKPYYYADGYLLVK